VLECATAIGRQAGPGKNQRSARLERAAMMQRQMECEKKDNNV
jgi:hypothetical protein